MEGDAIAIIFSSIISALITVYYVILVKKELNILQWDSNSKLYSKMVQDVFIPIMSILGMWYRNLSQDKYRFNINTTRSDLLEEARRSFLEHVSLKKNFPEIYKQIATTHQKVRNLVKFVNELAKQIATNNDLIGKINELLKEYKSQKPEEAKEIKVSGVEKNLPKYLVGYVFNKSLNEGAALSSFFANYRDDIFCLISADEELGKKYNAIQEIRKEILENIEKVAEDIVNTLEKLYRNYNIVLDEKSRNDLENRLSSDPFNKFTTTIFD